MKTTTARIAATVEALIIAIQDETGTNYSQAETRRIAVAMLQPILYPAAMLAIADVVGEVAYQLEKQQQDNPRN